MPNRRIAANVSSTTSGKRQHRHQRAAPVEQEHQHHQRDDRDLLGDRAQQRLLDPPASSERS
jgi:hypothetical protein